jgi:Acetyltransferases
MDMTFRDTPIPADIDAVRRLARGTGFFRPDEVDVAVELVEERLAKGPESGYFFWFVEMAGEVIGYVCYGPIPCTIGSYDLYWIMVDVGRQRCGAGKRLLALAEESAKRMGGRQMFIETAGKAQYKTTRIFYEKSGYDLAAELADFYEPGDAKCVYRKVLR